MRCIHVRSRSTPRRMFMMERGVVLAPFPLSSSEVIKISRSDNFWRQIVIKCKRKELGRKGEVGYKAVPDLVLVFNWLACFFDISLSVLCTRILTKHWQTTLLCHRLHPHASSAKGAIHYVSKVRLHTCRTLATFRTVNGYFHSKNAFCHDLLNLLPLTQWA